MNHIRNLLAGLLLACLLAVPVFASGSESHVVSVAGVVSVLLLAAGLLVFGAVTVTYQYPVVGTVSPTVIQMKPLSAVTAAVNFGADSDTIALITHNMQLGTIGLPTNPGSLVNETACLFPLTNWYYVTGGSINTLISGSIVSSSVFAITKASAAGSAGTLNFFCLRPWTASR